MEGGLKTKLLLSESEKPNQNGLLQDRNSVTALRCDFFSKLPDKVLSGFDPEAPFHINLSKTTGFIEGNSETISLHVLDFYFILSNQNINFGG